MFSFPANNINFPQKSSSAVLLFVLLANLIVGGILLPYQMAHAQFVVTDPPSIAQRLVKFIKEYAQWTWTQIQEKYHSVGTWVSAKIDIWTAMDTKIKDALKWAWGALRKTLLNMLVDDIVKWIQGGGAPRIVSDWQSFLKDAADQAGGQFIEKYLGMGFLCEQFDISLRIMLATPPTFSRAATCTISKINKNIQDFYNDIENGGWESWISVAETQNNIYGMYLLTQDYKWGIESAAAEKSKNEGISSSGFLGDKVCRQRTCNDMVTGKPMTQEGTWKENEVIDEYGLCSCSKWETRTPGKIAAEAMSEATTMDMKWLLSAKEFNEYMGAILDAVINRVIKEGVTAMKTSGGSSGQTGSGIDTPATGSLNTSSIEQATGDQVAGEQLITTLKLYKENSDKVTEENRTNLALLNQVRAAQVAAFTTLENLINQNCPLPAGVTRSSVTTKTQTTCNIDFTNLPCESTVTETADLSAPGLDTAVYQKITTTRYTAGALDNFTGLPGVSSVTTSSSKVDYNFSSIDSRISEANQKIAELQARSAKSSAAFTALADYNQIVKAYSDTYGAEQRASNDETKAKTQAAETAMKTKRAQVIPLIQAAINSNETDMTKLFQQAQDLTNNTVQEVSDLQTDRGVSADCSIINEISGTSLYKTICDIQKTKTAWDSALKTCQTQFSF